MEFTRIILALLAISGGASYVQAQDGGAIGGICQVGEFCPGMPGPDRRDFPNQPGYVDRREVRLGQYFRDQNLSLLRLFNLSPWNSQGLAIESVEIFLQDNGRSTLTLMADGYVVAAQNYLSPRTVLFPNRPLELGQDVRNTLDLVIRGKLYIDRIAVNLRNNYQPNPPPYPPGPGPNDVIIQGSVFQSFYGPGNVDIGQITGLMNYQGYQITSIIVRGRALNYNSAQARVLINGMIEGQVFLGEYETSQEIFPRQSYIIGRNVNAVTLLVDGGVNISTVQVRLRRF